MLSQAASFVRSAAHQVFPRTSFRLIHTRRRHDEVEMSLLPLLASGSRVAVDAGANVGRYTAPLSKIAHHVHAFEPHPRLCRILRASLPKSTTIHQVALSDEEGESILHVPIVRGRGDEGIAHLSRSAEPERSIALAVRVATLDSFGLSDVGFLKVDVEGHELHVLEGAQGLIGTSRPNVLIECEDRHRPGATSQVRAFFAQRGYEGFFVYEQRLNAIASFTPSMQDPAILARAGQGSTRLSIPYVNNFIFVPRETMHARFEERASALLTR